MIPLAPGERLLIYGIGGLIVSLIGAVILLAIVNLFRRGKVR